MKGPRLLQYYVTETAAYKPLYMVAWRYEAYPQEVTRIWEWRFAPTIVQYQLAPLPQYHDYHKRFCCSKLATGTKLRNERTQLSWLRTTKLYDLVSYGASIGTDLTKVQRWAEEISSSDSPKRRIVLAKHVTYRRHFYRYEVDRPIHPYGYQQQVQPEHERRSSGSG